MAGSHEQQQDTAAPDPGAARAWFEREGWRLPDAELKSQLARHGVDEDTIRLWVIRAAHLREHASPPAEPQQNGQPAPPGRPGGAPPQNLEAEEHVLGAMMIAPGAIVAVRRYLSDDGRDFYRESHARIYRAAVEMHDRGDPVDAITLTNELERRGELEAAGGRVRLHELARLVPSTPNAPHYAKIVSGCATLRDLIRTGGEIAELGWNRPGELDELLLRARDAVTQLEQSAPREPIRISWAHDFIAQKTDQVRTLLGDGEDKVLPAGGFSLVYGKGGQGKTTLTLTAVAALASATGWLGITVPSPSRILMIENEGPKAPFVEKLDRFADQWDGPDWRHNVAVYEEPWGRFNLADRGMRDDLLAFTRAHQIDLVVAGPLRGLGIEGPGAPSETDAFLNLLKQAGLGTELAWWIVHHTNKQNQISGDWDRQPDLLLRLTYEGKRRNRLTFEKVRWGNQGREPLILEWLHEGVGYRVIDTAQPDIDWLELEDRCLHVIAANPGCSQRTVEQQAGGKASHVREAIQRLLADGRLHNTGKANQYRLQLGKSASPDGGTHYPTLDEELEWH